MLLIFGLGYTAARIAAAWPGATLGTTRDGRGGSLRFADEDAVRPAIAAATHILSSVPPEGEDDPVLARYGDALAGRWLGYLSSTGVYGDAAGAWVDESAPTGSGRRSARAATPMTRPAPRRSAAWRSRRSGSARSSSRSASWWMTTGT